MVAANSNKTKELKPRIIVIGVGGAGGNAVNNMIESGVAGVEFLVANTDAQALSRSLADSRVQMGVSVTEGLGAGARPEVGAAAAEESLEELKEQIEGAHMVFITAGMGGGTGTGAAPVIAKIAKELGILTVGVVTKPFAFEGKRRMSVAQRGVEEIEKILDTLIVIPNQNLFRIATDDTPFQTAFGMADAVLNQGVRGVTDLMVQPGLINLDFADVRTVMNEMGKAMMGTGEAEGEGRAVAAARNAIANPLLDEISMRGAKGVLVNITGGRDLTLFEVDEAANEIRSDVDEDANIIIGSTIDENLDGFVRITVVATGIGSSPNAQVATQTQRLSRHGGATDHEQNLTGRTDLEVDIERRAKANRRARAILREAQIENGYSEPAETSYEHERISRLGYDEEDDSYFDPTPRPFKTRNAGRKGIAALISKFGFGSSKPDRWGEKTPQRRATDYPADDMPPFAVVDEVEDTELTAEDIQNDLEIIDQGASDQYDLPAFLRKKKA